MTEHVLGGAVISPGHTELEADERLRPFHSHPVGKCSESVIGEVRPNSAPALRLWTATSGFKLWVFTDMCKGVAQILKRVCFSGFLVLVVYFGLRYYALTVKTVWSGKAGLTWRIETPHADDCQSQTVCNWKHTVYVFSLFSARVTRICVFHCRPKSV